MAVAIIAGFSDIGVLEEMVNVGTLFAFVLVSIGVIVLRRTRPDLERSFKVPFMPVMPILSVLACLWLMINLTAITWVRFLVWMAIGVAVYFVYGKRHSMVGRRGGDGLALTQEEIKATWHAEEDAGGSATGSRAHRPQNAQPDADWLAELKRDQPQDGPTRLRAAGTAVGVTRSRPGARPPRAAATAHRRAPGRCLPVRAALGRFAVGSPNREPTMSGQSDGSIGRSKQPIVHIPNEVRPTWLCPN